MTNRGAKAAATLLAAAVAVLPATTGPAAHATPSQPALAAPGAPMRILPHNPPATVPNFYEDDIRVPPEAFIVVCSQGPVGTVRTLDGTAQRVMLTASHCISQLEGMPELEEAVLVNIDGDYQRIGARGDAVDLDTGALTLFDPVGAFYTDDWGIVRIDDAVPATRLAYSRDQDGHVHGEPVELTSIKDYSVLAPGQLSFDVAGQPICKDGSTTGRSCGTLMFRHNDAVFSWNLGYVPGDSGGVNYDPRDGSVIGVSSMVLGPVGKTQTADRIVEAAYGIPDGQVNEHFALDASTAPHAEFTASEAELSGIDAMIEELNPDYVPPVPLDELDKAIGNAQQDTVRLAEDALRGQVNPAELQQTADHHAGEIAKWAELALAEKVMPFFE